MKNVCIVIDDYLPESTKIAAKMMHDLATGFREQGIHVIVITPSPHLNVTFEKVLIDNITVYKFLSGEIKNISKFKRLINESLLSFRAWISLKSELSKSNIDLIVYYSPSIFWGFLVSKLKKLWSAKAYLVLRDIFPQWVVDNGMISPYSPITLYLKFFEYFSYIQADKIGLMSQKNLEWFNNHNKNKYKTEILYNWTGKGKDTIHKKANIKERLNLANSIVYFYGGNIGKAQDINQILRLAEKMQNFKDIHFLLMGNGDELIQVKEYSKDTSHTNLTLLEPVSQTEFDHILSEIDVGLFCLNKNHTTHNFPGKILGYMAHGKPILGTVNPGNDLLEIINLSQAGFVSIAGDDEEFYRNALKLYNKHERDNSGENAKSLMNKNFSVESAIQKILNTISND